ncbi:MAG TPA: dihydrodipicolinate synthase family protein [Candidatus Hydrogenedens sp.]|nr:dihydrodipicolinate synthase family protein [Candidatus Hydrogenedens sp.]
MQIPEYIYGSIAPTFTIFKEDGSLDLSGQVRLLEYMVNHGSISAFFIRSGMGQMYAFSFDEVKQIAEVACKVVKGHAAVLIGCSGIWDRNYDKRPDRQQYINEAVELSRFAEGIGADGVVHTIPEALLPEGNETLADLTYKYFETICSSVKIPVLFYQTPGTKPEYCLTPELLRNLSRLDNLVAGKVSSSDGGYMFDLARAVRNENFSLVIGNETIFYAGLVVGCRACIGQGTTLNPQIIRVMVERYCAGDTESCLQAQEDVNLLVRKCPNPVEFFKRYITEKGYPVSECSRTIENNPYFKSDARLTMEEYEQYKKIYEEVLSRY